MLFGKLDHTGKMKARVCLEKDIRMNYTEKKNIIYLGLETLSMEPIFLLVEGDVSAIFRMEYEDSEVQILVQEQDDSDSDGRSIDYGDESEDTLEYDSDIEIIREAPSEDEDEEPEYPELQHALVLTRLEKSLEDCLKAIPQEIEADEDYITAIKFSPGQRAILISSAGRLYKQPLHYETVKKLLESGNWRNPCDNNPIEAFTVVKIK